MEKENIFDCIQTKTVIKSEITPANTKCVDTKMDIKLILNSKKLKESIFNVF